MSVFSIQQRDTLTDTVTTRGAVIAERVSDLVVTHALGKVIEEVY